MKTLLISDGIVPIAQFKSKAAHWLKRVVDSEQPLVITVNGKPAGVLISPIEFDRMQERQRLVVSIANGLADAEMGRVLTTGKVEKRLSARRKRGRRVPEFPMADLRELIVGNYRIIYRSRPDCIEIITVFEGHFQQGLKDISEKHPD